MQAPYRETGSNLRSRPGSGLWFAEVLVGSEPAWYFPASYSSEVMLASSVLPDPTQEIPGFRFLCSYARVPVFRTTPKGRGSAQLCQIFSDKLPGTLGEKGNQYVEAA